MNERMVDAAVQSLGQVDVAVWLVDVTERYGPGDRYVRDAAEAVGQARSILGLNKIDRIAEAEDPARHRAVPPPARLRRGRARSPP